MVDFPPERAAVTNETLSEISRLGKKVEILEGAILEFLARIRQGELNDVQSRSHMAFMSAAIGLRSIADIIADDLVSVARAAVSGNLQAGTFERTVLSGCYQSAQRALELAVNAMRQPNERMQTEIKDISDQVKTSAEELMSQVAAGLDAPDPNSLMTIRLQTTFVDGLRQISTLAKRIVRTVLNVKGAELPDSRTEEHPVKP
jgi:Na+/phosphate symporter